MTEPSRSDLRGQVARLVASGSSNQVGAALGAHAFPVMGPAGVVGIRQIVASVTLWSIARPPVARWTSREFGPVVLLAAVLSTMNLSLYAAISRVGLGLAVTLEFLGPLAVALLASRSKRDLAIALFAAAGVYVLVLPDGSSDIVGFALAVLAAGCWAAYILLNRVVGSRVQGLQAPAVATAISAVIYTPVLVQLAWHGRLWGPALCYAIGTGVLSSVVPYAVDLTVLRTVPPKLFGVLMSMQPGLAALSGMMLLAQVPSAHEWLGMAMIVCANVAAVGVGVPRRWGPRSRRSLRPRTGRAPVGAVSLDA